MKNNHQFSAPHQNGGGDRPRKVQFSEVQKPHDLDLGLGQGHISMHNTCRTTNLPDHVTVLSCGTEIWPFGFCEISTFLWVWTRVIALLEGNSKIGLRQAVDQVPYYYHQPSVLSSMQNGREDRPRKLQFFETSKAPWPWPWIGPRSYWSAYLVEVYPHTKLGQYRKNFLWTYRHTWVPHLPMT